MEKNEGESITMPPATYQIDVKFEWSTLVIRSGVRRLLRFLGDIFMLHKNIITEFTSTVCSF